MSRITRGKIALRKEVVDFNGIVASALASCRPLIEARRHRVDLELPEDEVRVDADPTRLSQIVFNLVSNAVKYTPEGGYIGISVTREPAAAVLRVRDTGIGIAPELLPHVFDLFVQGHRSLDRADAGLGIGLTVVKRLVELHGGSVAASSSGPGKGSEFCVRLALAARPADPERHCAASGTAVPQGPAPAPRRRRQSRRGEHARRPPGSDGP